MKKRIQYSAAVTNAQEWADENSDNDLGDSIRDLIAEHAELLSAAKALWCAVVKPDVLCSTEDFRQELLTETRAVIARADGEKSKWGAAK